jgi:hypothetical protein
VETIIQNYVLFLISNNTNKHNSAYSGPFIFHEVCKVTNVKTSPLLVENLEIGTLSSPLTC